VQEEEATRHRMQQDDGEEEMQGKEKLRRWV
jgi:hypothetical protein